MKKFQKPKMEVILPEMDVAMFEKEDVLTASIFATVDGMTCGDLEDCESFDPNGDIFDPFA